MERATSKARQEFVAAIQQHAGGEPNARFTFAQRLMRFGATYGRIAEHECSAPDARYGQDEYNARCQKRYEEECARYEKKAERIEEQVTKLCAEFGCKPVFGGDPRGNTIKIATPDGHTTDWGHEGIGVPTS